MDSMEIEDQFDDNCSEVNTTSMKLANIIDVTTTATCLTFLLIFLALLVFYKAYKTTLQRLLLYLTIATAVDGTIFTMNIELQFNTQSSLCGWIGFFNAWTSHLMGLFSFAFTVYLTIVVYQKFKGQTMGCLENCRNHPVVTEVMCIVIIILLPLGYLWVPAIHHSYGLAITVCYIKLFDIPRSCSYIKHSKSDYTMLLVLDISLHIIVSISFIILVAIISMSIAKIRHAKKESMVSIGRAIFLVLVVGTTLCIRTALIGEFISLGFIDAPKHDYLLKIFGTPVYGLTNFMIPLGFAVYLYSPKKLIKSLCKAVRQWTCCRRPRPHSHHKIKTKHDIDEEGLMSVQFSIRRDVPSYTTGCSPCYTNQFTDITENVSISSPKYGTLCTPAL